MILNKNYSFPYSGHVHISVLSSIGELEKTIQGHNDGLPALFTSVANIMAGADAEAIRPKYLIFYALSNDINISIRNGDVLSTYMRSEANKTSLKPVSGFIPLESVEMQDAKGATLRLTAAVSRAQLNNNQISAVAVYPESIKGIGTSADAATIADHALAWYIIPNNENPANFGTLSLQTEYGTTLLLAWDMNLGYKEKIAE